MSFISNGARYAGNSSIQVYFTDGVTSIPDASASVLITTTTAVMTSCTAISDVETVGDSSTWTLSFTPLVPPSTTNFMKITFNLKLNNDSNFADT